VITAVDTNVLLDILIRDPEFRDGSARSLAESVAAGELVVSEPVYAEVAGSFPGRLALDAFLSALGVWLRPTGPEGLHLAGEAWRIYAQRRPLPLVCPQCGDSQEVHCGRCGASIRTRQHIVADFIVGAHAMVHADRLLTRDKGYYRSYFPELSLA